MPNGYNGRILRVDLTERKIDIEEPGEKFYRSYLGGINVICHYLLNETKPGIDPLGPENLLIMTTGVITGSPASCTAQSSVGACSPMSGAIGRSEVGGFWGSELKRAGFDAVVVKGASNTPVYLWVHDGEVEIRDASQVWGLATKETQEAICAELGDKLVRFAAIGPGGENLVRYACVVNDLGHAAGRTGMGAVMGSKKLKAIAARGHNPPTLADPARVKEIARWGLEAAPEMMQGLIDYGTGSAMAGFNQAGNLPTRNWQDGYFEGTDKITAQAVKEQISIGMGSCHACGIRCKKVVSTPEPFFSDPAYKGPEYETLAAFGSDCGVDNLHAIARAHHLCNAYSIDTISAGSTIAFAMECYERGLITQKDTDGLDLRFGNAEAMIAALEKIARREGNLGKLLAEGSLRAAQQIGQGAEKYAMQAKGVEFGMHEPRLKFALGLGYAIAPHGGDHCLGFHDTAFEKDRTAGVVAHGTGMLEARAYGFEDPLPANDLSEAKVAMFKSMHSWRLATDCMVMCNNAPYTHQLTADLINAVTGWIMTPVSIMRLGERAHTLERAYNIREGFTPTDDRLPARSFEPTLKGNLSKQAQDPETLRRAIRDFYVLMGWDRETGIPTRVKLAELGLMWVADELAKYGKAPQ